MFLAIERDVEIGIDNWYSIAFLTLLNAVGRVVSENLYSACALKLLENNSVEMLKGSSVATIRLTYNLCLSNT
jgi:hypothetical protein